MQTALSLNALDLVPTANGSQIPSSTGAPYLTQKLISFTRALDMDNFKRSIKRLFTRLSILAIVVVCGAIAIAQANREKPMGDDTVDLTQPIVNSVAESRSLTAVPDPVDRGWAQPANTPEPEQVRRDESLRQVQYQEDTSRYSGTNSLEADDAAPLSANPVRSGAAGGAPADRFAFNPPDLIDESDSQPAPVNGQVDLPEEPNFGETATAPPTGRFAPPANDGFGPIDTPPPAGDAFYGGAPDLGYGAQPELPPVANPVQPQTQAVQAQPDPAAPPATRSPGGYAAGYDTATQFTNTQPQQNFGGQPDFGATAFGQDEQLPPGNASLSVAGGAGRPGAQELEGVQSPALSIQKIPPINVRVGQPATFSIKVRNTGQVPADRVLIRDEVPMGTTLVDTNPRAASTTADGGILWELGSLRPGEEATVSMQVTPTEEGAIGSVATITMQAQASAKASATKPLLEIEHSGPAKVLVGDPVNFTIRLSNPGSGPATNVVLEEDVPEHLSHSRGPRLEYEVGTIPAGGSRRLELSLKAAEPGQVVNVIRAHGEGGLIAEHRINLEVVAPQLQVQLTGPQTRYLDRKATFTLAIKNPGTAAARNVELTTRLPQGLTFVSTNNSGRFDRTTNTIRWSLDQLPAGQFGEVQFTGTPTRKGEYSIAAEGTADAGLRDVKDHQLVVEGIAALLFGVADQVDPIEVGETTFYEIRVKNQGTKDASNVQFVAVVPPGLRAVSAEGPTKHRIDGDRVFFDKMPRLPAKGESTFKIQVEGIQAGDQRFRVQMTSDETDSPVVKEESTRVYSD